MSEHAKKDFTKISVVLENAQIHFIIQTGFFDVPIPWETYPPHYHSLHEVHFVQSGQLSFLLEDKMVHLSEGDICIIPPQCNHHPQKHSPSRRLTFCFSIEKITQTASDTPDLYQMLSRLYGSLQDVSVFHNAEIYSKHLSGILPLFHKSSVLSACMIKSSLSLAFLELTLELAESQGLSSLFEGFEGFRFIELSASPDEDDYIRRMKVEEFFEQHEITTISCKGLSAYLHLSERQTNRILKTLFGMSFKDLLLKKRIEQAKYLLQHTDHSAQMISQSCGFHSYNGFYDAFVRSEHCSPKTYRCDQRTKKI